MLNKGIIACIFLCLIVALLNPFEKWGDARYGEGFGGLINGGLSMGLLLLAGGLSVAVLIARKRAGVTK